MSERQSTFDIGKIALEVLIVILGILIAFQIDRWAEERRERKQEHEYLLRLKTDLQFEIDLMTDSIRISERRVDAISALESMIANPGLAVDDPTLIARSLERATWRSFPRITAYVYTELQSTGGFALIRSEQLRRQLAEYYRSIEFDEEVGRDLTIQRELRRETAGILSTREMIDIEDRELEISAERAVEIATELAGRPAAIELLPNIAQHHTFNKNAIVRNRDKAQQLVELIDELASAL